MLSCMTLKGCAEALMVDGIAMARVTIIAALMLSKVSRKLFFTVQLFCVNVGKYNSF